MVVDIWTQKWEPSPWLKIAQTFLSVTEVLQFALACPRWILFDEVFWISLVPVLAALDKEQLNVPFHVVLEKNWLRDLVDILTFGYHVMLQVFQGHKHSETSVLVIYFSSGIKINERLIILHRVITMLKQRQ